VEGGIYTLCEDVVQNENSDCFVIKAENIEIDCLNYKITSDYEKSGIYSNEDYTTIKNCEVSMKKGSLFGRGITLENSKGHYIYNNILNNQTIGLRLVAIQESIIGENVISYNSGDGIYSWNSQNTIFRDNIVENNLDRGLYLYSFSDNNEIEDNIFCGNGDNDIYCVRSSHLFENNYFDNVLGCDAARIQNNERCSMLRENIEIDSCGSLNEEGKNYLLTQDISSNSVDFSCLYMSDDTVLDCQGYWIRLYGKGGGIKVNGKENIIIKNCNIEYPSHRGTERHAKAIVLEGLEGFELYNNHIIGANIGIYASGSSNGIIDGLIVEGSRYDGLWLGTSKSEFRNIESNDNGESGIYIPGGLDNNFENILTNNNERGMEFWFSNHCTVSNSEFRDSEDVGVEVSHSNYIYLENLVINRVDEEGIYLEDSNDCVLDNVGIFNVGTNDDGAGIRVRDSNNNVIRDSISCDNGFRDFRCSGIGNTGSGNKFGKGSDCGVEYSGCSCVENCAVLYTLVLRDLDGNILGYYGDDIKTFQINQGEEFFIDVYLKDYGKRGVYAGYMDLIYSSNDLVDFVPGSLEINEGFGSVNEGMIIESRRSINEVGGVSENYYSLGGNMMWLFSVRAIAVMEGIESFELNPADIFPEHDTLIYGNDEGVNIKDIVYKGARLEIL